MDISVPATNAYVVQGQVNPHNGLPPTYSGYTGAGVIIGIIDTGLDTFHEDLRTASGTRVLYFWDQTGHGGGPQSGHPFPFNYNYGGEWTAAQINANTNADALIDALGTGTHLTGICASNGRATGNNKNAYRYIGMAPEADLIIVKSILTDASIIDGVSYVFQRAALLSKPAVVLVGKTSINPTTLAALMRQTGAHDGSSALDSGVSVLTNTSGLGKLVVAPVGDVGRLNLHASTVINSNGSSGSFIAKVTTVPAGTGQHLYIEAWHDPTAYFQVRLTTPNGYQSAWLTPGNQSGTTETNDGAYILNNDGTTSSTGAKMIQLNIFWQGTGYHTPVPGNWTLDFTRISPSTTGRLDAWITSDTLGSSPPAYFSTNADPKIVAGSPATGDKVISVTGYTTRTTWTNFLGQTSAFSDRGFSYPSGGIYDVCGQGPRRDASLATQVVCPDIAAPGEGTISALASNLASTFGNSKADDGVHVIMRGSAVAAAHVAGALALRLQQVPTLTPTQAKAFLAELAVSDPNTASAGALPNGVWGNGKLWINTTNPPEGVSGGGRLVRKFVA